MIPQWMPGKPYAMGEHVLFPRRRRWWERWRRPVLNEYVAISTTELRRLVRR